MHGSTREEHKLHGILEDGIIFSYNPQFHFRGTQEERAKGNGLSFVGLMGADHVDEIKCIVDDVVEAILSAMDAKTRSWVEGWLYETHIPQLGDLGAPASE